MSTYSSNLRVELITSGDQAGTWGTTTNGNFSDIFDVAIAGYQTVSVTSANQALTHTNGPVSTASLNQSVYAMLRLTTTTTAAFNVYAPPNSKQYIIWNNSGYTATIYNSTVIGNTTAAGTGVAISNGDKVLVWSDGTNFYAISASVSGTVPVTNGGTGATSFSSGGLLRGNGTSALSVASAADIVAAIGATAVTNATNATNVVNGGALGTPSSGTLTNATGLPLTTGVTGTLPVANGGTGQTTLTANNVLLGNGSSAVQVVAPGTSGNILTSNGTTWTSAAPASSFVGFRGQAFTSNGTFTIPTGITAVKITVVGGGGGGGGGIRINAGCCFTYPGSGSGGGGGGAAISFLTGLTSGNTLSVTVGAGGSAGAGNGGTGGNSSVASGTQSITTITANGGSGGEQNASSTGGAAGGAGGGASNGTINFTGQGGMSALSSSSPSSASSGAGGSSIVGAGGRGLWANNSTGSSAGQAGGNYGGGGGGSANASGGVLSGGAGGAGVVIFEW